MEGWSEGIECSVDSKSNVKEWSGQERRKDLEWKEMEWNGSEVEGTPGEWTNETDAIAQRLPVGEHRRRLAAGRIPHGAGRRCRPRPGHRRQHLRRRIRLTRQACRCRWNTVRNGSDSRRSPASLPSTCSTSACFSNGASPWRRRAGPPRRNRRPRRRRTPGSANPDRASRRSPAEAVGVARGHDRPGGTGAASSGGSAALRSTLPISSTMRTLTSSASPKCQGIVAAVGQPAQAAVAGGDPPTRIPSAGAYRPRNDHAVAWHALPCRLFHLRGGPDPWTSARNSATSHSTGSGATPRCAVPVLGRLAAPPLPSPPASGSDTTSEDHARPSLVGEGRWNLQATIRACPRSLNRRAVRPSRHAAVTEASPRPSGEHVRRTQRRSAMVRRERHRQVDFDPLRTVVVADHAECARKARRGRGNP